MSSYGRVVMVQLSLKKQGYLVLLAASVQFSRSQSAWLKSKDTNFFLETNSPRERNEGCALNLTERLVGPIFGGVCGGVEWTIMWW